MAAAISGKELGCIRYLPRDFIFCRSSILRKARVCVYEVRSRLPNAYGIISLHQNIIHGRYDFRLLIHLKRGKFYGYRIAEAHFFQGSNISIFLRFSKVYERNVEAYLGDANRIVLNIRFPQLGKFLCVHFFLLVKITGKINKQRPLSREDSGVGCIQIFFRKISVYILPVHVSFHIGNDGSVSTFDIFFLGYICQVFPILDGNAPIFSPVLP